MSFRRDESGEDVPRDLRDALDGWDVPAARDGFRADLRARFLAGDAEYSDAEYSEQQVVAELDGWDVPAAREDFRRDLRGQFMAGAATPSEPKAGKLFSFSRVAITLAAAAAVVLLYVNFTRPATESWRIVDFVQGASFELDGEVISEGAQAHFNKAYAGGGCFVSLGEEHLALVHLTEGVMLEFPAETELRLMPIPKGESGLIEIELLQGGLRVSTTEEFMGRVLVHTPEATIALTGDSIGVDVVPEGTCLCIVGGSAEMQRRGGDGADAFHVEGMSTAFMTSEGEIRQAPPGSVHHAEELEAFAELRDAHMY